MIRAVALCALLGLVSAWDVAGTPPMGFNTWNLYGCGVSGQLLMDTAQAMHDRGLQAAGYQYVNSDDCWMLAERDANGNQVANPQKFPNGFKAVADFIHGLNMSSGLYTAKGPNTCAGFAASCKHEAQDALQWASWGIDYVKDDSCSSCRNDDNLDYGTMWQAIQASGRPMVLTVEGDPTDTLITRGGYGNAKRVGHDISPQWLSMVSLVDIGSNLYPFAHNSTNTTVGGWWNDLDMIEVGNGDDFKCAAGQMQLQFCQAHFALWTIMKAPLILGNDITAMDNVTLAILSNPHAIAVNQDPLGIQGRRVAVQQPKNDSLTELEYDNILVAGQCDASRPTQQWTWTNQTGGTPSVTFLVPCDASDAFQQWSFVGQPGSTLLKNAGSGKCIDASGQWDPAQVLTCNAGAASQHWAFNAAGQIVTNAMNQCLDVNNFAGPDVDIYACKTPGPGDANQVWTALPGGLLLSNSSGQTNQCLAVTAGPNGGPLSTVDAQGRTWCLSKSSGGVPCSQTQNVAIIAPQYHGPPPPAGPANYSISNLGWDNQLYASGPWPHTRYTYSGSDTWTLDLSKPSTTVVASDHQGIQNDDLVGNVTLGGDFCLDLQTLGMLEVWAAPLTGGRIAVVLFNRSPGDDEIVANWADVGATPGAAYDVYDIWADADRGSFTSTYTAAVPARATAYLILSPA